MLNSIICGTSNLPVEEHDIDELLSPCSKTTSKKQKKTKNSKNPYASRGLDKFSALLDELESKKQKIYTQKGSKDISFVRFVYSSSNDWKPIIVKAKDMIQQQTHNLEKNKSNVTAENSEDKSEPVINESGSLVLKVGQESKGEIWSKTNQKNSGRSRLVFNLGQPSWYIPMMITLILMCLMISGRTFGILCSSIGWYFVPLIKDSHSSLNIISKSNLNSFTKSKTIFRWSLTLGKPKTKKDYNRKLSERIIFVNKESISPKSVLSGPVENSPTHAHRKSWS